MKKIVIIAIILVFDVLSTKGQIEYRITYAQNVEPELGQKITRTGTVKIDEKKSIIYINMNDYYAKVRIDRASKKCVYNEVDGVDVYLESWDGIISVNGLKAKANIGLYRYELENNGDMLAVTMYKGRAINTFIIGIELLE